MREDLLQLGARLLRGDNDDLDGTKLPHEPVERLGDLAQMLAHLCLDVALVARLRPASLVVPALLLLGVVGEILEPPAPKTVEAAALAPDDDDESALPAADQRHERGQVERAPHAHVVRHGLREGKRAPDVVQAGREDCEALRTVPFELILVEGTDAVEVGLEPEALVMRQFAPVGPVALCGLVEEGAQPGRRIAPESASRWDRDPGTG